MKKIVWIIVGTVVILLIIQQNLLKTSPMGADERQESQINASETLSSDLQNQPSPSKSKNSEDNYSQLVFDSKESVLVAVKNIYSHRSTIRRDEVKQQEINRLRDLPGILEHATEVLFDNSIARNYYGADQAPIRVQFIALLIAEAEDGNLQSIENILGKLGEKLATTTEWEKAIDADYTDLAAGYLRVVGIESTVRNFSTISSKIGLNGKTYPLIENAFYDSGLTKLMNPAMTEKLRRYFDANTYL